MSELSDSLEAVFSHLSSLGRRIVSLRKPGLEPGAIRSMLSSVGLCPPEDLVELYSLADGTNIRGGDKIGELYFFPGYYWTDLDEAVTYYRSFSSDRRWSDAWLPILADGGGYFYAVVCDLASPQYGNVVLFMIDEDEHLVYFRNVTMMMKVLDKCFRQNVFFVIDGEFEADDVKILDVARQVDPTFELAVAV